MAISADWRSIACNVCSFLPLHSILRPEGRRRARTPGVAWSSYFPLMAMRLALLCARSVFGMVIASTPFLKRASTLS